MNKKLKLNLILLYNIIWLFQVIKNGNFLLIIYTLVTVLLHDDLIVIGKGVNNEVQLYV